MLTIPQKPSMAPVERSIPAVIMTMATPTARIPVTAHSRRIVRRFPTLKKELFVTLKMSAIISTEAIEISLRKFSCRMIPPCRDYQRISPVIAPTFSLVTITGAILITGV